MIDKAIEIIESIVTDIELGMIMTGPVVNILPIGAQVQLGPNKKGLVHISRLADSRVAKVEDVVNLGDEVTVRVIKVDDIGGKIDLSMRPSDINDTWSPELEQERRKAAAASRGDRDHGDRGDRRGGYDRDRRDRRDRDDRYRR